MFHVIRTYWSGSVILPFCCAILICSGVVVACDMRRGEVVDSDSLLSCMASVGGRMEGRSGGGMGRKEKCDVTRVSKSW